jgi:carboxylesterase
MITPGCQPFFLPGGPFGCLLIHGFSTCPKEIRWLGTQLNEAGFSVLAIRLFGHATRPNDLQRVRFQDWIANVEDGVTLLQHQCDKLIVIGISLGGALALIAGAKLKIDGVVAIATPYLVPFSSSTRGLKILVWLMNLISLGQRSIMKSPFSHELDPIFHSDRLSYDSFPPRILIEANRLIAEMQRILPNVSAPTLLIEGEGGHNGEQTAAPQILEHLRAKRTKFVKVKPLLSEDARTEEQERISAAIIQFVASLSGSKL